VPCIKKDDFAALVPATIPRCEQAGKWSQRLSEGQQGRLLARFDGLAPVLEGYRLCIARQEECRPAKKQEEGTEPAEDEPPLTKCEDKFFELQCPSDEEATMCVGPLFSLVVRDPVPGRSPVQAEVAQRLFDAAQKVKVQATATAPVELPTKQLLALRLDAPHSSANDATVKLTVDTPQAVIVYERGPSLRLGDWLAVVPKALEHRCRGASHAARQIDFSWRAGMFSPTVGGAHEVCWARRDPELSTSISPDGVPAPARAVAPADSKFAPQDIRLSDGSPVTVDVAGAPAKGPLKKEPSKEEPVVVKQEPSNGKQQELERAPGPANESAAARGVPPWLADAAQHRIRLPPRTRESVARLV
jgi:hypothetical protein